MKAFSLLEVVLATALLMLAVMSIFAIFDHGVGGFLTSTSRMSSQAEMLGALTRLRRDLEQTTTLGVDVSSSRTASFELDGAIVTQPRHVISLAGLSNWSDPAQFDPNSGLPLWNLRVLYHSSLHERAATLDRLEYLCAGSYPGDSWDDFSNYLTTFPDDPPPMNRSFAGGLFRSRRRLCQSMVGFEVAAQTTSVSVTLRILAQTQRRRDEMLEGKIRVQQRNSS